MRAEIGDKYTESFSWCYVRDGGEFFIIGLPKQSIWNLIRELLTPFKLQGRREAPERLPKLYSQYI